MTKLYAGLAAVTVAALLGATAYVVLMRGTGDAFAQCRAGQVAGGAIGGPFTLVDQTGATVTDVQVLTKPALIYFGYTFCPDVCPLDVSRNAVAVDILEEQGFDVVPVFISIDPARDTPEVLADYAANMHPRMIALTGSEEQVKAASLAYKTYYMKREGDDEYYLMDHSVFTYLMLPQTGFADFYRRETTPEEMAESVACFLSQTS